MRKARRERGYVWNVVTPMLLHRCCVILFKLYSQLYATATWVL